MIKKVKDIKTKTKREPITMLNTHANGGWKLKMTVLRNQKLNL